MKPSEYVKQELGISLKEASIISQQSEQTLINWYNNPKKRKVFELVIKGLKESK
jgi:hypothetical protein